MAWYGNQASGTTIDFTEWNNMKNTIWCHGGISGSYVGHSGNQAVHINATMSGNLKKAYASAQIAQYDAAAGGISGWYTLTAGTGIVSFGGDVSISGTQAETITVNQGTILQTTSSNALHSGTTHDYTFISSKDGNTNVTGAELEELTDGSTTTLHDHDSTYYTETEIDTNYYTRSELSTISSNTLHSGTTHDYAFITSNDGATDVTAAELEELTDGSETTLHTHAAVSDVAWSGASEFYAFSSNTKDDITSLFSTSSALDSRIDTLEGYDEFDHELYATSANIIANFVESGGTKWTDLTDGGETALHTHAGMTTDVAWSGASEFYAFSSNTNDDITALYAYSTTAYNNEEIDLISGAIITHVTNQGYSTDTLGDVSWSTPTEGTGITLGGTTGMVSGSLTITVDQGEILETVSSNTLHSGTTHDYAFISSKDAGTDVSAAELEELTDGSTTTLHDHNSTYYTEDEIDSISGAIVTHVDNKYYTQDEVDAISGAIVTHVGSVSGAIITHVDNNYYTDDEMDSISSSIVTHVDNNYYTDDETDSISGAIITHVANNCYTTNQLDKVSSNTLHSGTTHDYAFISSKDAGTDVTAAELEELTDGSQTALHTHAAGAAAPGGSMTANVGSDFSYGISGIAFLSSQMVSGGAFNFKSEYDFIIYSSNGYRAQSGTDQSLDFQSAHIGGVLWQCLNALSSTGGSIYVRNGHYTASSMIFNKTVSNIELHLSKGATIKLNSGVDDHLFYMSGVSGWRIHGGEWDGNYTNQTPGNGKAVHGIYFFACHDMEIDHTEIYDTYGYGIEVVGTAANHAYNIQIHDNVVHHCYWNLITVEDYLYNIYIHHNTCYAAGDVGIAATATSVGGVAQGAEGVVVDSNLVYNITGNNGYHASNDPAGTNWGIAQEGAGRNYSIINNIVFSAAKGIMIPNDTNSEGNCLIQGNHVYGIIDTEIQSTDLHGIVVRQANCQVIGNRVRVDQDWNYGIYLSAEGNNCIVANNYVTGSANCGGITLSAVTNNLIEGNHITVKGKAIFLTNACSSNSILNNRLKGATGIDIDDSEATDPGGTLIAGNNFKGCTTSIDDTGLGTRYGENFDGDDLNFSTHVYRGEGKPTASAANEGRIIRTSGSSGEGTWVWMCVMNSSDNYEWIQLGVST